MATVRVYEKAEMVEGYLRETLHVTMVVRMPSTSRVYSLSLGRHPVGLMSPVPAVIVPFTRSILTKSVSQVCIWVRAATALFVPGSCAVKAPAPACSSNKECSLASAAFLSIAAREGQGANIQGPL